MQTYNQVLTAIKTVGTNNKFVNAVTSGTLADADIKKTTHFPFIHIVLAGASQDAQEITYNVDIYVGETILADESNEDEALSNTLQIITDVIAQVRFAGVSASSVDDQYRIDLPIACEPFLDRFDNLITGWKATLPIRTANPLNACIAPTS